MYVQLLVSSPTIVEGSLPQHIHMNAFTCSFTNPFIVFHFETSWKKRRNSKISKIQNSTVTHWQQSSRDLSHSSEHWQQSSRDLCAQRTFILVYEVIVKRLQRKRVLQHILLHLNCSNTPKNRHSTTSNTIISYVCQYLAKYKRRTNTIQKTH